MYINLLFLSILECQYVILPVLVLDIVLPLMMELTQILEIYLIIFCINRQTDMELQVQIYVKMLLNIFLSYMCDLYVYLCLHLYIPI